MKYVWLLCCTLLLAACGQEEVAKAETGRPAPPILALGPHDEVVSLPASGERPLILNFWSATCGMCIKELREIQDLQAAHPQAVGVLAVNIDGADSNTLQALAAQRGLTVPLAADQMGVTAERYRVSGTPTNYLIGRDGRIIEYKAGMLDADDLQRWFATR
ncbi:TlpA disulfide reductase family protein [uncultured Cardiobacterium sp.]|uniref:TlpA family protein disulfide reductase n=1 Tax=uncultured Cardiobacterium sp. TaxID=417619 RepID=UPI00261DDA3B|nr:TlpA disulfide reductase family protein [uncultured Cardiobacterium sp.]